MKKALKLALEKEQIEYKCSLKNIDGFEIHLHGDTRDNFDLVDQITKPIFTVHYPLDNCDIPEASKEYDSEYMAKVIALCQKTNAGLVLHAETDNVINNPDVLKFCNVIKESGICLHIENCYRNVGAIQALEFMHYLRQFIGENKVYPLLDSCHLIMSEMSFKYEEFSFSSAIDRYKSSNFKIHLNDCLGSGERETGGIHGTNFHHNLYLLNNILWKLHCLEKEGYKVVLVLEIEEKDYVHVPDALELADNIDRLLATY